MFLQFCMDALALGPFHKLASWRAGEGPGGVDRQTLQCQPLQRAADTRVETTACPNKTTLVQMYMRGVEGVFLAAEWH